QTHSTTQSETTIVCESFAPLENPSIESYHQTAIMAYVLPPSPQPGSTCDFCNTSPATVVVKGRLACELHKTSEIIELGLSSLSSVPGPASSG
ncbi:unnamed protein product, partial [Ectocarpus sp. 12 AP-2014]